MIMNSAIIAAFFCLLSGRPVNANDSTLTSPTLTAQTAVSPKSTTIRFKNSEVTLSPSFHLIENWKLSGYSTPNEQGVLLSNLSGQKGKEIEFAFDSSEYAYLQNVTGTFESTQGDSKTSDNGAHALWVFEDQKVRITKEVTPSEDGNAINLVFRANFKAAPPKYFFASLLAHSTGEHNEDVDHKYLYYTNSIERVGFEDSMALRDIPGPVRWVSLTDRYFAVSLVAPESEGLVAGAAPGVATPAAQTGTSGASASSLASPPARGLLQPLGAKYARMSLVFPVTGNEMTIPLKIYFGSKQLDVLRSVDRTMDHIVDFGMFTMLAYPLLSGLKLFNSIFHNFGVAIILMTIILKVVLFPLTYWSMKSMRQMAKVQPQIQKLRERHKNDPQALNREMMMLMKGGGYNPVAGCLPILMQMPIFIAFYSTLYGAVELYQAPFVLWIHDLSLKDPYFVTPVLLTVLMYLQQKLTPPSPGMDPTQQKIMQFMPLMFGGMMVTLPAGLTLYMVVNSVMSILQQMIMTKKLGPMSGPAAQMSSI